MIIDFNSNWQFCDNKGTKKIINLPHDAMIEEKRYENCINGKQCSYFPGGKYTYTKIMNVSIEDIDKYTALLFEGVYRYATVKLNGEVVGTNINGFSDFIVDLSGKLKEGSNEIKVIADNTLIPNCRWYTGSGIYRTVHLIRKEINDIRDIKMKTISINPSVINIEVDSINIPEVEIYDGENVVYNGKAGKITLHDAKLWDIDNPYLYKCIVRTEKDIEEVNFGIRKVEIIPKKGLFINGKKTLLRGGCIHSDNGILGAASYKEAEYRKVKILKQAGYNAIRCAHNPCSRYFLEACDQLGMYIVDEAFDGWYIPKEYHDYSRDFYEDYEFTLSRMVKKDYNHPSVIMYSIGNEVSETAEDKGLELCGILRDFVKALDDTRPITCGVNLLIDVYAQLGFGIYKDKKEYKKEPLLDNVKKKREKKSGSTFFNSMMQKLSGLMFFMSKLKKAEIIAKKVSKKIDIVGLNYGSSRYLIDSQKYPDRIMLGTETMVKDLPYNWDKVKKIDGLLGDFVWAAWDYLGEAGVGDWTYYSYDGLPLLAGSGTIDLIGNITAESEFMQRVWGTKKKPYIGVRPLNHQKEIPFKSAWRFTDSIESWNWQGFEGKKAIVEVYADASFVELYLNNKLIRKKKINKYKAFFKVKYQPGELKAITYDDDKNKISEAKLVTGNQIDLYINLDKNTLKNNEICFLEIKFNDENESIVPYIEQKVELEIIGNSIEMLGYGSGRVKTNETYKSYVHTSFRGSLLAVFKAKNIKQSSKIRVKTNGYENKEVIIEVI